MSNYFLTKTWGFNPSNHPILGFGADGAIKSYLRDSDDESWVLIAATANDNSLPEEQGRLLGMVKLGRNQVDSEAVLNLIKTEIKPSDRDTEGRYRWPYGLPMLEAYAFDGKPKLKDLFGHGLAGMVWAQTARDISIDSSMPENSIGIIESLPKTKCFIHDIPEFNKVKYQQEMLAAGRGRSITGPGPSSERSAGICKDGNPVVYMLKLTGHSEQSIYKIGYSQNLDRRLKELNKGLIYGITGLQWEVIREQAHISGIAAYTCEQLIHERLKTHLVSGENEIYNLKEKVIESEFNSVIADVDYMFPEIQQKYSDNFNDISEIGLEKTYP
ncbi:MAG: GIY-YIG nuclease family protein [Gammaproteobacteria bacterium]|nr:GIY-YIG nuclease family protein [Gammaproteobacteria bacterium]